MEISRAPLSCKPPVAHITNFSPELLLDIGAHLPLGSLAAFALVSRTIKQTVQPALDLLRKPTGILDLPSELIVDIASYLPLGSLAAFSLTSRDVRELVQPVLYRKLELCCDGPKATQFSQRARVRRVLTSIAEDPKRCEMLRGLDLREWGWMGQEEISRLRVVVQHVKRMEQAGFPTTDPAYVPFFLPVWDVILALPALETLDCHNAPVVPLQLQRMRSLRRLKLAEYRIIASEDGSLPPLEHLELEFVTDITEDWLAPSLLRSLKTLKLRGLERGSLETVSKMLAAGGKTTTLETLVLDLGLKDIYAPPPNILRLQEIITGAMHMPLLRSLEVLSVTGAEFGDELESTLQLVERIPAACRASRMEHFVLGVGPGRANICHPPLLAQIRSLLILLPQLQSFGTNLIPTVGIEQRRPVSSTPLDQAKEYFAAHGGLRRVTIPCGWHALHSAEALIIFERVEEGARELGRTAHWCDQDLELLWD